MNRAWLALSASALATAPAAAGPIFFVVAERPDVRRHGDLFVLPLTEPADIAHARRLIADGPEAGGSIAVAAIAAGADGVNRDYLAPGRPAWSWHVTEFLGFADFTAEVYDGWPRFVEADPEGWVLNTQGRVGFWSYTVVAELGVPADAAPEPGSLALVVSGSLGAAGVRRLAAGRR